MEEKDEMVIVYSEHHQHMVFFKDDLLKAEYVDFRVSSWHKEGMKDGS